MATLDRITRTPSASPTSASLLATHRRFEDERAGFSEEFLQPSFGGVRTVAVLTRPLGPVRPVGWVVCHSLAHSPPRGSRSCGTTGGATVTARAALASDWPRI